MKSKKDYYKLDEIGIVGTQDKISAPERRRIQKETGKIIEAYRNAIARQTASKISFVKIQVTTSNP